MKKDHKEFDCFGNPDHHSARCRKCRYRNSCNYYAATESTVNSRTHLTSFEAIQSWLPDCADFEHIPGCEPDENDSAALIPMLGQFFRFLLELDDYTTGIICELISPADRTKKCTVSHLGRLHGCSRQAMHRKILDIIAARPELTSLLKSTMYKLSSGRQRFMRYRSEHAVAQN